MRIQTLLIGLLIAQMLAASPPEKEPPIVVGAAQLDRYLPLLTGKQIALVVNHSSRVGNTHLADTLQARGVCISRILAPEHGIRGDAPDGALIDDDTDARTGAPIVSLYGKKRRPEPGDLAGIDLLVFDIQDVGARFYTYISTLFYLLEACGELDIPVLVLDRPNPNGHYVDGPVLDLRFRSFVGIAPLPIVHGCTVGELARLFTGEFWTGPKQPGLTVIPCLNYHHNRPYPLPVAPSPNLPSYRSILLYPSLCLFEGTEVSVGRGTDWPFQLLGHPAYPDSTAFQFTPRSNAASRYPPMEGRLCRGLDLRGLSTDSLFEIRQLNIQVLLEFYNCLVDSGSFFLPTKYFNRLAGTDRLWEQIEAGCSEAEIRSSWQADLECFRAIRRQYLLYPD
ncbi:MAG: DUF1343 domain-containing protein [Saprospiraceae bacterium]|nr:DUF1343 domain-containing protein [Saprospiraceae bacterium]